MRNTAEENANRTINRFRGCVNQSAMLHGVLCLDHGYDYEDAIRITETCDMLLIAMRLDDLMKKDDVIGPLKYSRPLTR